MAHSSDVVVDVTLTNFVRDYRFERQMFAGDAVAPILPVTSFKGRYKELGKELLNLHVSDTSGDRAETNEIGLDVTEKTYEAIERRLKIMVTDKEIRSAPRALDPMRRGAIAVTHALKLRQEDRIQTLAGATSNTSTPSNDWNLDAATIVSDVNAGIASMKGILGFKPTHWLIPDHVADEIAAQQDIQDLIKTAAAMGRPVEILNTLHGGALPSVMFGLRVIMPTVMFNDAEPKATENIVRVWGDDSYLFSLAPGGEGASWAVQPQSLAFTIVRWRSNDPAGWWIKAVHEKDEIEVTTEAVHKFVDVT